MIYYGKGFTAQQQNQINEFVANIGSTDYWKVVEKAKTRTGTSPGRPHLQGIYSATYNRMGYPRQIQHSQFKSFVDQFLTAHPTIKRNNAVYLFVGGQDVEYVFDQHDNAVMGNCSVCGKTSLF